MTRCKVLLADDHRIFLDGLERLLQPQYDIVGKASDGRSLVELARELAPDLIVTDYSMPGLSGVQAISALREAASEARVVILTMYEDVEYATEALESGVNGYVLKRAAASDLLEALREAEEGRTWISPIVARQLEQRAAGSLPARDQVEESVPDGALAAGLSRRQRLILAALVKGKIAKEIAGDMDLSRKTVEYHKYKMMRHLGVKSTAALIAFAFRNGLDQVE